MASKKEQGLSCPSWGKESEINFVDGLGRHQKGYVIDRSDGEWLKLYIQAHKGSPHAHHRAGVIHAQKKLEKIYHG